MEIQKFSQTSGTCCLILGILISVPASGHSPDDLRCDLLTKHQKKICLGPLHPDVFRSSDELKKDLLSASEPAEEDLSKDREPTKEELLTSEELLKSGKLSDETLLTNGELTEKGWEWWEKDENRAERKKARIADRKYEHYQGGWKRPLAFFSRSMNLTGKIQETNGINTGLDSDGLPGHFNTSKTLREISFGWSKKKILEDLIVAFRGPETLFKWKNADGSDSDRPRPWSLGNLLLERLTVDANVSHGRTVDFKEDINGLNDLDSLTTKTTWMVKVQYSIPIDKLFGLDYKNE